MTTDDAVLKEIMSFFEKVFELKKRKDGYAYADYSVAWLNALSLLPTDSNETKTSRTTKKLQEHLTQKIGGGRLKKEARVAEGMTLRFGSAEEGGEELSIDSSKMQAFDLLDIETGAAYEFSLSDAYAEVFKDVLKALLDSRVRRLYICMRNHNYKGSRKSGYLKVRHSAMIKQYVSLAKLYKLDVFLIDIFPECNKNIEL